MVEAKEAALNDRAERARQQSKAAAEDLRKRAEAAETRHVIDQSAYNLPFSCTRIIILDYSLLYKGPPPGEIAPKC